MNNLNQATDYYAELSQKGLQPSVQRVAILEFLCTNRIHPTAEQIWLRLSPGMPTLSRTTVYNTLKLFAELGIVRTLVIEEKEMRFDIDTSHHGHFSCDRCGRVFDFAARNPGAAAASELDGFEIRERHLYYKGLCKECRTRDTQKA
jgi:Fur family transcriptional regulator, peroxide stress response regulator